MCVECFLHEVVARIDCILYLYWYLYLYFHFHLYLYLTWSGVLLTQGVGSNWLHFVLDFVFVLSIVFVFDLAQSMCLERFLNEVVAQIDCILYLYWYLNLSLYFHLYLCLTCPKACAWSASCTRCWLELIALCIFVFVFCICICIQICLCIFTCICIWPGLRHVSRVLLTQGVGSNWLHFVLDFVFVLSIVFVFDLAQSMCLERFLNEVVAQIDCILYLYWYLNLSLYFHMHLYLTCPKACVWSASCTRWWLELIAPPASPTYKSAPI